MSGAHHSCCYSRGQSSYQATCGNSRVDWGCCRRLTQPGFRAATTPIWEAKLKISWPADTKTSLTMTDERWTRTALVEAGRRLFARGILVSIEGNMSVRLPDDRVITTPSGLHKGSMTVEDLVVTDLEGRPVSGGRPSSELRMHLTIYRERDDVRAVVHAHPPVATGYAVAGQPLPPAALAEMVLLVGCVPIAPYGTPSTDDLAGSVVEAVRAFDIILLANHGAVTVGDDLLTAEERMYQLEHFAQIALVSHLLGGPKSFSSDEITRLSRLREQAGSSPVPLACYPSAGESGTITLSREELVALIADAVRVIR